MIFSGSDRSGTKTFPVYCGWCLPKKNIVARSSIKGSTGICDKHQKQMIKEAEKAQKSKR